MRSAAATVMVARGRLLRRGGGRRATWSPRAYRGPGRCGGLPQKWLDIKKLGRLRESGIRVFERECATVRSGAAIGGCARALAATSPWPRPGV